MSSSLSKTETKKAQIFAALKVLRETTNTVEKCKALTCLQNYLAKFGTLDILSEVQSRDLIKFLINAFISGDAVLQEDARSTFTTVLRYSKDRKLIMFHKLTHISLEDRLKIFQVFEKLEDDVIKSILRDKYIVEFFKDSLNFVSPDKMNWLAPNTCIDNIKVLQFVENKTLTNEEQIEEYVMICVLNFVHRIYTLCDSNCTELTKFNIFFVDKVTTLAYMGHKRQRAAAIKILQLPDMGNYVRSTSPAIWQEFKNMLQNMYCLRMTVLVGACEPDWSLLWTTSIRLLGTDLHRGAGLINNLLSVEERAFKSVDTIVRKQAFLSWILIIDNFALDEQELATARRVKLLCIPLNAKNSKTETMTLTKLEVWWHLIYKLYAHIGKFANPVLTQFLNFCFGPLGDTPLLSAKFNVIASPGKRFQKTRIVAVDALLQLLTDNKEYLKVVKSSLKKTIPSPVSEAVFQEHYKIFIHCVGEAILAINQPSQEELGQRIRATVILWTTLLSRVKVIEDETSKVLMYKEIILLVIELSEHTDNRPIITDVMLETILPSLDVFPTNCIFHSETTVNILGIFTKPAILNKITRKNIDLIKCLLLRGVKPPDEVASYISNALEVFRKLVMKLDSIECENSKGSSVLWIVLSEMITKYMSDGQEVNEGDAGSHDFTTVQTLIKFPFTLHFAPDVWHMKSIVTWKTLYKQFSYHANLVPTVKPNEFVSWAITVIQNGIQLDSRCAGFAISCLDGILTTMSYKHVLDENGFLPIIKLINDLCIINLPNGRLKDTEPALRALSSVLITLYGHVPTKVTSCLEAIKPAIEHMLKPCRDESLVKEIASTWETIISIFKGLGALLLPNVLLSYQNAIRLALHHDDSEIVSQTLSYLQAEDSVNGPNKDLVEKFLKEVDFDKISGKESGGKCGKQVSKVQSKVTKLCGSFLNRKTASPRPGTPSDKAKDEKRRSFFPEPESQEYVTIKSDFKFDVNRLTEHQKESLLRRREDIPALYNDLSQSCSQDTQNLQEWFEKRKSELADRNSSVNSNRDNVTVAEGPNSDADKENKSESGQAATAVSEISNKEVEVKDKTDIEEPKSVKNKESCDQNISSTTVIDHNYDSDQLVAKKLDFESRSEYPEGNSGAPSTSQSSDSAAAAAAEKPIKRKETKRGVKRKASGSDTDSEENLFPTRRRRTNPGSSDIQSDSDSVKSYENEEVIKQLSKRTKNEMSRLQINMVFDSKQFSALPSRRRSKVVQDSECEPGTDSHGSPETTKTTRNKAAANRGKDVEKDAKSGSEQKSKKRGRKSKTAVHDESKPGSRRIVCGPVQDSLPAGGGTLVDENATAPVLVTEKSGKNDSKSENGGQRIESDVAENNSENSSSYNDDSEGIVESSQASTGSNVLDKKYTKKQCFIRIDKMQSIQPGQTIEVGVGNEKTKVMKGRKPDSPFKVCTTETTSPDSATKKPTDETEITAEKHEGDKVVSSSEESRNEPGDNKSASPPPLVVIPAVERAEEPIIGVNSSPPEVRAPQNDVTMSPVRLPSSILNSCSPKNSLKRYSKLKSVTTQGRAAHMLGLVTKQAIAETKSNAPSEDDPSSVISKRTREPDEEFAAGKKERLVVLKEPERLGSPSGSRQEKIFNKMRTTFDNGEAAPQNAQSHFGNLKNDGEKSSLSKNTDKERISSEERTTNIQIDKTREKTDDDNASVPNQDRELLPMLEWSSANPPSLTASPSASILKRQRQFQIENDPESPTPACKRKRVSFADPPVSMEMGYEITVSTTPHRMNKIPSSSRIFFPRKDSPIRLKQTKIKTFQVSPGKPESQSEIEVDKSANVVDNLTDQIIDDSEESIGKVDTSFDSQVPISLDSENQSSDPGKSESDNQTPLGQRLNDSSRVTLDNLNVEIEIAAGSRENRSKDDGADVILVEEVNSAGKQTIEETETQKDIFDSVEVWNERDCDVVTQKSQKTKAETGPKVKPRSPPDENSLRCVDISTLTNPSAKEQIVRIESSATAALEDTVDVQNVTGLNSTTNSDELFSAKPIRTSTQATDAAHSSEFDTITVTDSVFSNLPFSQASQASNDTMELDQPELLDSTKSIFPSLTDSRAPIDSIIGYLADPLWKSHLSNYLHSKGIETVGNLARLTEREVNWIPVKRSPKVPFVRDVLQRFDKSSSGLRSLIVNLPSIGSTIDMSQTSITTTPNTSISSLPPCSTPIGRSLSLSETVAGNSVNGGSVPCPGMTHKSTETQVSLVELLDEIDASVVLKSAIKRCSAENIIANYKLKMKNMADEDLERATVTMLGIEPKTNADAHLKTACRTSGLGKVLGRLPDIFSNDKQFFSKVLATYRRKLQVTDCMQGLDFEEVKAAICQRCTSSDLAEMLSKKLKDEEESGVTTPMTELSSLQAMLKRMPKDLIISHTVANEELISPLVVLDIAFQNNTPADISFALDGQSTAVRNRIFNQLCTIEALSSQIENRNLPEETLTELLKTISRKMEPAKFLDVFNEVMKEKFISKKKSSPNNT